MIVAMLDFTQTVYFKIWNCLVGQIEKHYRRALTNVAKPALTQDSTLRLNCSILCSVVWCSCGKKFSNKLQKPQNRAARALTFSNYEADPPQLLKKLNCDNLET